MEKFITLVTALLTLSLISERVINWLKLHFGQLGKRLLFFTSRGEDISKRSDDPVFNTIRERKILGLNIVVSVVVALLMNANVFDLLSLSEPTMHFGWKGIHWGAIPITGIFFNLFYSITGCILGGMCMSMGSKFWHDLLGILLSTKNLRKK